jgi:tetratricopeptide (TPR) repeat protein
MMTRLVAALTALFCLASSAAAAWQEASSSHFIIYADADEAWLRGFSERLERFDGALRTMRSVVPDEGFASNRLTIYVADDAAAVQKLCGCANVYGFYVPRAGGSIAYTVRRGGGKQKWDLSAQQVLYHEYSHHFLFQNFAAAYPAWFSEGFAEFNATATFEPDGSVSIGAPPLYRAYALMKGRDVMSVRLLLNPKGRLTVQQQDALYGRGWLLTHYLLTDPGRSKLLTTYLEALRAGTPPLAAGERAFGELAAFDRTLEKYKSVPLNFWTIKGRALQPGPIRIRQLGAGEAALMPVRMRSDRGVDRKQALRVVADARRLAAPFPQDPSAQLALAEAEYDAGEGDAAMAAAERAIAADPKLIPALLYKGRILLDRAKAAKADAATWKEARGWLLKANRIDPDSAEPLLFFYVSFLAAKEKPTANAVTGLQRAFALAPEDAGVRWLVARQYLIEDKPKLARETLTPLAYDPHQLSETNLAATLVSLIDAGKTGPEVIAALEAAGRKPDVKTATD